jgi:hypothetical protein
MFRIKLRNFLSLCWCHIVQVSHQGRACRLLQLPVIARAVLHMHEGTPQATDAANLTAAGLTANPGTLAHL